MLPTTIPNHSLGLHPGPQLTTGNIIGNATCLWPSKKPLKLLKRGFADICVNNITANESLIYFAPNRTWWACKIGLARCINSAAQPGLCILIRVLPQIFTYSGPEGSYLLSPGEISQAKWASSLLIPALVRLSVAGSAAVGTVALIEGELEFTALTQEVNQNLEQPESAMNQLQDQINSLAEMVLQNRRGLDILFMSQGGLCIALGEDCCFYANQSGIVRSSLAKVKENIQHINKIPENKKSCFQGWFE